MNRRRSLTGTDHANYVFGKVRMLYDRLNTNQVAVSWNRAGERPPQLNGVESQRRRLWLGARVAAISMTKIERFESNRVLSSSSFFRVAFGTETVPTQSVDATVINAGAVACWMISSPAVANRLGNPWNLAEAAGRLIGWAKEPDWAYTWARTHF